MGCTWRSIQGGSNQGKVARIEPIIVYDFEPGVIVRSYWYPPWRNRHYFPRTGKRPRVGRLEILPKHRISKPEEYFRFWSASSFPPAFAGHVRGTAGIPTQSSNSAGFFWSH